MIKSTINNNFLLNKEVKRRFASTSINQLKNKVSPIFTNRNPRNLERLRIGYKPDGYHVEYPDKQFWHK